MSNVPPGGGQPAWGSPQGDPPPPPPPAPGYGAPPPSYGSPYGGQSQPSNGLGIAAMVVGIVALVLSWIPFLGLLLAIVALVLGVLGLRKANRGEATNKGMAIAGLATGGVALIIGLFITIGTIAFFGGNDFKDLTDCLQQADTPQDQADCQLEFQQNFGN